jgi:4-amino-4-deoxy-L-arabinose transferase-like glycosyltransferase
MPFGPPPFGMEGRGTEKLIAFLRANRHGERIMLAAPSAMEVSSIIAQTGDPVISLGGFMGADPVLTRDEFAEMVDDGEIRFVLVGAGPGGGGPPGMAGFGPPGRGRPGVFRPPGMGGFGPPGGGPAGRGNGELLAWVREHGKPVDPAIWRVDEPPSPDGEDEEPEAAPPPPAEDDAPGMPPGGPRALFARMRRMTRLYDCQPELGLVAPE